MKTITLIAFLLIATRYAHAGNFVVTNTNNSGPGSLRQAIISANANPMDADLISFNIPTSDPHFSTAGVYEIILNSVLPYITSINVTIDGTSQPGNTNTFGPEILLTSDNYLLYGLCLPLSGGSVKGLNITNFQNGIIITKYQSYPSGSCTVTDCYIGVDFSGYNPFACEVGVVCYSGASGNTIKNNIISGNTLAGIGLRNSNNNTISGNKIGTNKDGLTRIPNYIGIAIDSSSNNTIGGNTLALRNIISGNSYAGIAINSNVAHDNNIKGNYIGININAVSVADTLSNYYGIAINDSPNNNIGGNVGSDRNIISGNTDAGIAIIGTQATGTKIKGNYIGTNASGTDSIPNTNGILISNAGYSQIGGSSYNEKNVISGNKLSGITIAYFGARKNIIKGNYIGTDKTGMNPLSNHTGIYLFSNANSNIVGGPLAGERNIISANYEMGISMEAADSNIVMGNYIGPDSTGLGTFYFAPDSLMQGNGLYFNSNAKHNIAGGNLPGERNIISGNRVYGLIYYGNAPYNSCIGNYIGVDKTGNKKLPNTTGICVDGGSHHNPILNNVLSGNLAYGIFIVTNGTFYNELKGNKIGTNAAGTDSVPNQIGVILGGGTRYNQIGGINPEDRNIISGNYFNGIEIADIGTKYNTISGNYIGTDINGTAAVPNHNGIGIATRPSLNTIEHNLISGNNYIGIILYEKSDSNFVYNNKIGTASNGISPLGNGSAGIVIKNESNYNKIGGPGKGNIIAFNDTSGIVIGDSLSKFNTISENTIFDNALMGIDLFPFGINENDPDDTDSGCNDKMNFPAIQNVTYNHNDGVTYINGNINYTAGNSNGIKIEIFKTNDSNTFHHGDATAFIGHTFTDVNGNWFFQTNTLTNSDKITATATDYYGNTSEFSLNADVISDILNNKKEESSFLISPNPATGKITMITDEDIQSVTIFNSTGKIVPEKNYTLQNYEIDISNIPAGLHLVRVQTKKKSVYNTRLIKL